MTARKVETEFVEVDEQTAMVQENTGQRAPAAAPKQANTARNGKSAAQPFDPTQYLSNFDGRDYLEVKWRIMWLRTQHPDAHISTEIIQHNEESGFALFRAEVDIPGGGKSTGWGSETVRDFHDYIEAAETKAIGRALASLGFGTQFCADFDFASKARPGKLQVVDAPVNLTEPRNVINRASSFGKGNNGSVADKTGGFTNRPAVQAVQSIQPSLRMPAQEDEFDSLPPFAGSNNANNSNGSGATEKQIKAIYAIGRANKRLSESQVNDHCAEVFGVTTIELTKAEASQFIDLLKGEAAA